MDDVLSVLLEKVKKVNQESIVSTKKQSVSLSTNQSKNLSLYKPLPYDEKNASVKKIKELGFTINTYYQTDHPYSKQLPKRDVFLCQYKEWDFQIEWTDDPDIDIGILALKNPRNRKTGMVIESYCDLFCRNTSKDKLKCFLQVFDEGYDAFLAKKYGKHMEVSTLLKKQNVNVVKEDVSFDIDEIQGAVYVGEGTYVRFYIDYDNTVKTVVTNTPYWTRSHSNNEKVNTYAFSVQYNGKEDIEGLCKCIESFKAFLLGKSGYPEWNEKEKAYVYYQSSDFVNVLRDIRKKIKNCTAKDNSLISINIMKEKSVGKKQQNEKLMNSYKGLEIDETRTFMITSSVGDVVRYAIKYRIHLEYDRSKNDELCCLTIEQEVLDETQYMNRYVYGKKTETKNKVEVFEKRGTFSQLSNELKTFLETNLTICGLKVER